MTRYGGQADRGAIFAVRPDGTGFTLLHSFRGRVDDGRQPYGGLLLSGATLYGMTYYGGQPAGYGEGVVFSIGTDGSGFTVLHVFVGNPDDGGNPYGEPVLGGSTLYGISQYGGANDRGAVFSLGIDGSSFTLLHSFSDATSDGRFPRGSLIRDGSILYGMTQTGGASNNGTVFSIGTDGSGFTLLHSFAGSPGDGQNPYGDLVLNGGTLYGMTPSGGSNNYGTAFSLGIDGSGYTVLHSFAGGSSDGRYPYGDLTPDGSALYGLARDSGANSGGVVFSLQTDGTAYTVTHSFATGAGSGYQPRGSLVMEGGSLYGLTTEGGADGEGTVFSIGTEGSGFTLVHSFSNAIPTGRYPRGSLIRNGSLLYGMARDGGPGGEGVIFTLKNDGTGFTFLHAFAGGSDDGENPYGSLLPAGSKLYGMTRQGGAGSDGTVFAFQLACTLEKTATVEQPGKRVMQCQPAEMLFGEALVGDIQPDTDDARAVAASVPGYMPPGQ
jgi:uncharacterized repeat protein (TIGR03803 family)